jgi:hypothetical protein
VNKLRLTGLSIEEKQKRKGQVLSVEKLKEIGARFEYTPRKSLKHLAQEIGVSKSSARTATQLLKLRPHKKNYNPRLAAIQPR